jgi:hypothetical protein
MLLSSQITMSQDLTATFETSNPPTPSAVPTVTPTPSMTPLPTQIPSLTPSQTSTSIATQTPTSTATQTSTSTVTQTSTSTVTQTSTSTAIETVTQSATSPNTTATTSPLPEVTAEITIDASPSATVTMEATAEITAEVTAELTQESIITTETATQLAPTETSTPTLQPLVEFISVFENFDDPTTLTNWIVPEGWDLAESYQFDLLSMFTSNRFNVLSNTPDNRLILNTGSYSQFDMNLDFSASNGLSRLYTHVNGDNAYIVSIDVNGLIALYRNDALLGSAQVAVGEFGNMRQLNFAVQQVENGYMLTVSIEGVELIRGTDPNPLPAGTIQIGQIFNEAPTGELTNHFAIFDNILIAPPNSPELLQSQSLHPQTFGIQPLSATPSNTGNGVIALCTNTPKQSGSHLITYTSGSGPRLVVDEFVVDSSGLVNVQTRFTRLILDVSPTPSERILHPSFSPDGSEVAYVEFIRSSEQNWGLFAINTHDCSKRTILPFSPQPIQNPDWSPDGTQILYQGDGGIFIVPAIGGMPQQIIPGTVTEPDWSPDGSQFLYVTSSGLRIYNFDPIFVRSIPNSRNARRPKWAPNGQEFLATSNLSVPGFLLYQASNFASQFIEFWTR